MVRIRLLFDKAEATDHEAERDAFMNKAQALLTQHSIDFADLKPSAVTADEVVTKRVWVTAPYTSSRSLLLSAIARANDIKMVNGRDSHWVPEGCLAAPEVNEHGQSKTKGRAVYLTGWSRDIDAAVMLFASLQIQMDREFLAIERPYYENAKAWRNSFMIGFASGVGKRLGQARRDAVNDAVAEARGVAAGPNRVRPVPLDPGMAPADPGRLRRHADDMQRLLERLREEMERMDR